MTAGAEIMSRHTQSQGQCFNPALLARVCARECENNALFMKGKEVNFNNPEEKVCVETIFQQAMQCLKEEDRTLKFIESLLPLLKRGIGVHHSGLLPILKEVIELLFQEQLIKVALYLLKVFTLAITVWGCGSV